MKNYFDFRVKGLKLFAVCIGYLVCCLGVSGYLALISMEHNNDMLAYAAAGQVAFDTGFYLLYGLLMLVYFLASFLLAFFFVRICVGALEYRDEQVQTDYCLGKYIWLVVRGTLLSCITLGIYYPWFVTRLVRFFSDNASCAGKPLRFKGLGSTLFCLMTFVLLIPYALLAFVLVFSSGIAAATGSAFFSILVPVCGVALILLLALFYYLEYRWFIDFAYGQYRIQLKSSVVVAMLFFFIQFTLSILTLGLYLPVAGVMIYRFLVENTVLLSAEDKEAGRFGYSGRSGQDSLYVFAQFLLCIVTVGIYLPWMVARVGHRLVSHTYLERPDVTGLVSGGEGTIAADTVPEDTSDENMAVPVA